MSETTTASPSTGNDSPSGIAGFGQFSENDFIEVTNDETVQTDDGNKPPEAKPADDKKGDEQKPPVEIINDKKGASETVENKDDKSAKKPDEQSAIDDELANPGEVIEQDELVESSWIDTAKELDIEIKEDSIDAFKAAYKEKIENIRAEATKDIQIKSFYDQVAELPVKSQLLIRGLREGLTQEQIEAPFKMLSELKVMSDADLVAEDMRLQGHDQDVIDNRIEELTEANKLEIKAKELRTIIDNNEKVLEQRKLEEIKEIEITNKRNFEAKLAKEAEVIKKEINMIDTFMEAKISAKNKEYLQKKWDSGAYHELAKDPKKIAQFMLWSEFGDVAVKNLKNRIQQGVIKEQAQSEHNVPPVIKTGSAVQSSEGAKDPVGNWGALEHLQETE